MSDARLLRAFAAEDNEGIDAKALQSTNVPTETIPVSSP